LGIGIKNGLPELISNGFAMGKKRKPQSLKRLALGLQKIISL
jgi:hypothetical protein